MSDNPFAQSDEDDGRTVIRPRPARQQPPGYDTPAPLPPALAHGTGSSTLVSRASSPVRVQTQTGSAPAAEEPAPLAGPALTETRAFAASPILAAATPLLSLLARLQNVLSVPDPASLRDRTANELRRFEQALREQKLPLDLIRPAHYALCASLDDVVRNTPWGSRGPWVDTSLVATFHGEVRSGERFFEVLAQLRREPGKYLPVIELMYACIMLGMQGRYRLSPRGPAELDRVREETYAVLLRARGPAERGLSPHWQGVSAPYRPLRRTLPVWVTAMAGAGLLAMLYVLFAFSLNGASDRLFAQAVELPPDHMATFVRPSLPPPPKRPEPASPPPSELARLATLLQPERDQKLVAIDGTDAAPIVRITAPALFASASATLAPDYVPLLRHLATVLRSEASGIDVVGYTDNQPIRTVRFPSNFQLSDARARAAAAVLADGGIDPSRLRTEGRADADPIAPNTTPAGREQNRRIELILYRTGAAS
jgi:type VI secretion system protein ImpK